MISSTKAHQQLIVPIILTGAAVIVTAVIYRLYFTKKKGHTGEKSPENGGKTSEMSIDDKLTLADPQTKYALPLIEREEISHDTRRFRFRLPTQQHRLGLPVGQHIHLSAKINNDLIIRAYTPVSSDEERGYVDLVIKVYFKNINPRFPDGGKMSQHLNNLKIGETIDVRGPSGRLVYNGQGKFTIKKMRREPPVTVKVKSICMIAGGTGITPMLQIIRYITRDPTDRTEVALIFANQTEKDILLREELEDYAQEFPRKFKLWYTLDSAPPDWKYSTGFVTENMMQEHLFPPSPTTFVVMCGPPPMVNHACLPNLEALNYDKDMCFTY